MIKKFRFIIDTFNSLPKSSQKYLRLAFPLGFLQFLTESSLAYIIQLFFSSIGLIAELNIPFIKINPSITTATLLLSSYAIARLIVSSLNNVIASDLSMSYLMLIKDSILKRTLHNAEQIFFSEASNTYNNEAYRASSSVALLYNLFTMIFTSILYFILGAIISLKSMIIGIGLLLIIYPIIIFFSKRISSYSSTLTSNNLHLMKSYNEGFKNIILLKINNILDSFIQSTEKTFIDQRKLYKDFSIIQSINTHLPTALGIIIIAIITLINKKYSNTSPEILISFFYIFIKFAQSLSGAFSNLSQLKFNENALTEVNRFIQGYPLPIKKIKNHKEDLKLNSCAIGLDIKNISFSYNKNLKVIEKLCLRIPKGSTCVIKGTSGSGKSTLLKIITGLLPYNEGEILVNTEHKHPEVIQELQESIAYVGPTPYLTNDSVLTNLSIGSNKEISESSAWKILKELEIAEAIENLPNKLNQKLNDHTQLSTGQQQRLCIARAILKTPSLLILDEATANVDDKTESIIIKLIQKSSNNRTNIIVTHKHSFDTISDEIFNLQPLKSL